MTTVDHAPHGAAQMAVPPQAGPDAFRPPGPGGGSGAPSSLCASSLGARAGESDRAAPRPAGTPGGPVRSRHAGDLAGRVRGAQWRRGRAPAWCTARVRWPSPPIPRIQGGAMGTAGCAAIVAAYSEALSRGVPIMGLWHSGGSTAGRGRGQPARGGNRIRRDDPRVRAGTADLGGARPGGLRRRVRPGADRHRDPVRSGPHLRHRPGCGALRDRRGRGHGAARRPRAAQPPVWRGARGHRERRGALDRARLLAAMLSDQGKVAEDAEESRAHDRRACCPSPPAARTTCTC